MLQSFNSPPPSPLLPQGSPRAPSRGLPLRLPDVANVIVKLRRSRHKDQGREYPIVSSSGEPCTQPSLAGEGVTSARKVPLVEEQRFLCKDGVDLKKLLRMMRVGLLEEAQAIGATVLVEEHWACTVHSPRRDGVYKVDIRYSASAARSNLPDAQQPVALEKAKGIPGLMTVIG
ncbi:hypothetical protein NM688_g381 [Phlebia brevispora]|uniref:Uncharacterized protein n=1 Tax=Phlebia brevispora TaxID=194682 RepID=A0ACC1TEQ7_9APHY|nr:hypothetical protein NM688_g381 [Phlebia brevispora]